MSLTDVPEGKLAAIVTYLELRKKPPAAIPPSRLTLERIERPDPAAYRELFRRVGSRWLWFSRLLMSDEQLTAVIHHPEVEVFAVVDANEAVGMLELDRRVAGECELSFVGLNPESTGQGHGRWLLAEAVERAFGGKARVDRVHVHTCTLDHPAALSAYRRAGFVATGRAVEIFIDPRLAGILPSDCAPQIPLLSPSATSSPSS